MNNNVKIFLVDDDALFLKSLEIDFMTDSHFEVSTFPTGEQCISHLSEQPDIIILDYHLDGIDPNAINGIATLDNIKALNPDIPVVMLSSQDKIEVAIACMHHKAHDYVVKSETAFLRLQKIIQAIFDFRKTEKELQWYMGKM